MLLYSISDIDDCPQPGDATQCDNASCVDLVNGYDCICDSGYENPTASGCTGKLLSNCPVSM